MSRKSGGIGDINRDVNQLRGASGVKSTTNLTNLHQGLRQCKDQSGFFNPYKAFDCLNDIQKA